MLVVSIKIEYQGEYSKYLTLKLGPTSHTKLKAAI